MSARTELGAKNRVSRDSETQTRFFWQSPFVPSNDSGHQKSSWNWRRRNR